MIKKFINNQSGNVAIVFAIALTPMTMAGAAAFEYSLMRKFATEVQYALDSALVSVAKIYSIDEEPSSLDMHGQVYLDSNLGQDFPSSVSFEYLGNPSSAQAVEYGISPDKLDKHLLAKVTFTYKSQVGFFGNKVIERESVVAVEDTYTACVLALNTTASRAIDISGSTSVDTSGCTIASNSNSQTALYLGGSGTVAAECLRSSGGISASPAAMTLECNSPATNSAKISNPYLQTVMPSPGIAIDQNGCGMGLGQGGHFNNCQAGQLVGGILNIIPGTYDGLSVKDKLHLSPGNYVITGPVSLNANAAITGTGVTLFLDPSASVTINGGASVDLTAPTLGTYQGFLVATLPGYSQSLSLNGNGNVNLTGIIYAQGAEVIYSGNNSAGGECVRIVADTVIFTGSSKFKSDCASEIPNEPKVFDGVRIAY